MRKIIGIILSICMLIGCCATAPAYAQEDVLARFDDRGNGRRRGNYRLR